MSNPRFDDVLDSCIADIVAGRRTVADCLAEWPQFSDELAPLLEAASAMRDEPRVAERPPDPARRAQFMATLRETPQQSPRPRPLLALGRLLAGPQLALPSFRRAGMMASAAVVLVIAMLAATLVLDRGATTAYASTVTVFTGDVEVRRGDNWDRLEDGATVAEGARLRTGADGSALLTFADGSTVGIEPGTELEIELARINGSRRIFLRQFSGRLWNDVVPDERAGSLYVVRTPNATVTAQGTLFETAVEGDETTVSTADGLVEVESGEERVFVAPGEITSARRSGGIAPVRARAATEQAIGLSVNAPFAAAIVAPDGKATGVRPDGIAFQQIAGAATSHPSQGPQQLELHRPTPGTYQLFLRRVGDGDGEIVLTLGSGAEVRIPVERLGDAVRIELRVTVVDGRVQVTPVNVRALDARERGGERVVVTEAARRRARPISLPFATGTRPAGRDENRGGGRAPDASPTPDGPGRSSDDGDGAEGDDRRDREERAEERTEQREQRRQGLEERARERLRERIGDESEGRLRQLLDDESGRDLRERLEERARRNGGNNGGGNGRSGGRDAPDEDSDGDDESDEPADSDDERDPSGSDSGDSDDDEHDSSGSGSGDSDDDERDSSGSGSDDSDDEQDSSGSGSGDSDDEQDSSEGGSGDSDDDEHDSSGSGSDDSDDDERDSSEGDSDDDDR